MAKQCANSPQTAESKGQKGPQCADGWQRREGGGAWEGDAQCVRGAGTQSKWSLKRFQKLNGLHFMSFRPTSNATRDSRAEVEPNFWLLVWRRDQSVCRAVEGGLRGNEGECRLQFPTSWLPPSVVVLAATLSTFVHAARHWHNIPVSLSLSLSVALSLMCWVLGEAGEGVSHLTALRNTPNYHATDAENSFPFVASFCAKQKFNIYCCCYYCFG